ncbi:GTP 3',8-cyclase MoaA [Microbacterium bovistercoris]|uniref:GTP 3',8-cyclase n=1 Tax=Microbacterium bovistercoris TaxID=2293570 RepID=A0A371NP83_9MICO|nr:GTP 3',8-cyclase MoaA [Microbacterium bovistercoris]REJ03988.1 GTP 3',8-cyclase MoaA [Microbacterium bovistercoris]
MSITHNDRSDGAVRLPSTGMPLALTDRFRRPLRDLRISITDRCNFRCVYCMPKEVFGRDYAFLDRNELLSFEEITRIARVAAAHGVHKIRLTGGEPLLRRGIEELISQLAELRTPEGDRLDIALTTNGSALTVKAAALKAAGLTRVTVSVDSLDDELFQKMNDVRFPVSRVLDGIDAAHEAGLGPIRLNMVVKRGLNDGEIIDMAHRFKGTPYTLRFIEYMDVGNTNGWSLDEVVPSSEVVERINAVFPLEPLGEAVHGETAKRWRYADGSGEIGLISSVTNAFCGTCNRARISTEGRLFTCLFASEGHDLRALLRGGASDDELSAAMASIWGGREDRYSEIRSTLTPELREQRKRIEMSYIGG